MIKEKEHTAIFWILLCFKMVIFSIFRFFTFWVLTFFLLYYLGPLRKFQTSILLLLIITSLGSLYLTYINPKKLVVPYFKYEIKGKLLRLTDILFHHLPLLIFLVTYDNTIKKDNLYFLFISVSIYLLVLNPFIAYNLKFKNIDN